MRAFFGDGKAFLHSLDPARKTVLVQQRPDVVCWVGLELKRMGELMYMFVRKYTKVRSVADAARRAKSGIGQILRESYGFRFYYELDGGEGVGVAVMIFEDRESANVGTIK